MRTTPDEQDVAAIRQLVDDAQAAQFDVEPLLALHTDDTIVVNFVGRRVSSKQELRQAMETALASPWRRCSRPPRCTTSGSFGLTSPS